MRKICVLMAGVGAMALLQTASGCGSEPAATSTTSTITGTIQQETFSAPITAVKAGNVSAPVDASGRFQLVLERGAVYQFSLVQDAGEMPLVVRATASRFDTSAEIESGGASIDIGAVHFWDGTQASGSSALLPPAVAQEASVVCEGGAVDDDDDDGTEADDDDDGTEADNDGAQGVPDVMDRQPSDKMGLSQFNLPEDIECEGADDDDDDDDGEDAD